MEHDLTRRLIEIILTATSSEFHFIKRLNAASVREEDEPIAIGLITSAFPSPLQGRLNDLCLAINDQREQKLTDFLYTVTTARIEWVEAVKAVQWDPFNWSSETAQLFLQSESIGIAGTVAFAVVAGAMTLRAFKVPKGLSKQLHGAKQTVRQQVKQLVEAEKRREAELKSAALSTEGEP